MTVITIMPKTLSDKESPPEDISQTNHPAVPRSPGLGQGQRAANGERGGGRMGGGAGHSQRQVNEVGQELCTGGISDF